MYYALRFISKGDENFLQVFKIPKNIMLSLFEKHMTWSCDIFDKKI